MALDPHRYVRHPIGAIVDNQKLIRKVGRREMWQKPAESPTSYMVWLHDNEKYLLWCLRKEKPDADDVFERVGVLSGQAL